MEHTTKRKLQAIETKQQIFDAAMELIKEKGIEHVQIEDISQKANVSVGLFYKYFTNKSDVIAEALNIESDTYYINAKNDLLHDLRGRDKILVFARCIVEYHKNNYNKIDLTHTYANMLVSPSRGQRITDEDRAIYIIISEALEEMKEDSILSQEVSVKEETKNLILLIRGTIFEYLINEEPFNIVKTVEYLVSMHLDGMLYNSN